jgi:AraC family transcriptional regulator, transcriptional activator of the genes for pyochelin and ferripyochelin receptors
MEFKIIAPGGNELEIISALPQNYNGFTLKGATAITGRAKFGELTFQNYIGNGFSVWYSNYDIAHNTTLVGKGDIPLLELHMQFRNLFTTQWEGIGECDIHQYNYNLTYVPFMNNTATFEAGKLYTTFDLHFEVPYLQQLAGSFPLLDQFVENVLRNKPVKGSTRNRFLPPGMIKMVKEILGCPFSNAAAERFIECKAMEILLYALDDLSGNDPLVPLKLSALDIECLHEAKRLITEDFQNKMSLIDLARKVYLNDYKLKKGFKYLFGTTVFEHLNNERMKQAKEMVLDRQFTFSYIAIALGYESESSFNKAFKKHFEVTPGYMRNYG